MAAEMNRLVFEGDVVATIAGRLIVLGEKATSARSTLITNLDGLGTPWGTSDEFARKFAKEYLPNRDKVLEASKDLGDFLTQLGQRVKAMGGSLSDAENDNT
jgi:hypothetical protein